MSQVFQRASISPDRVPAGDSVEFTITLAVGPAGTAERSRIVVDCPAYLGWNRPTREDQETGGYISLQCSNPDVDYRERVWDVERTDFYTLESGSFKGMAARMMVLDLEGPLQEGDELAIKWGWARNGLAVGCKVATLAAEPEFDNVVNVRYFSDPEAAVPDKARSYTGYDRPVPDVDVPLTVTIVPREVERLRLIRGISDARLVPYDRFYNVAQVDDVRELVDLPHDVQCTRNRYGVFELDDPDVKVTPRDLPLECTPRRANVFDGYNVYFGDLHTHSRFSIDCIQREKSLRTPADLYDYARQVAGVDFACVTDHHQPWDVQRRRIGAGPWEQTLAQAAEHNVPGQFAAFPGIEFRGPRGDTAVVFADDPAYDVIDNPEMESIDRFWEAMQERDFVSIPHFHNGGSLEEGEWISTADKDVEPVLEIYSCHGSYEAPRDEINERNTPLIKHRRPDRNGRYFLRRGYRYGFVCNSDGHKGVIANNGLTAVLARSLDRVSILEALRARRCYGTTNARIRLLFGVNGELMGAELPLREERGIVINVAGEAPLKCVDLFKNGERYKRWRPGLLEFHAELSDRDEDAASYYVRAIQVDNHIAYSSPIWVGAADHIPE